MLRLRLPTRALLLISAVALLVLAASAVMSADAEQSGRAGIVVSFEGSMTPKRLPRNDLAPVSLTLAGDIRSVDGLPPPRLGGIQISFGARSGLDTVGLPVCQLADLRPSAADDALANCGPALVGRGHATATVEFPGQRPYEVLGHILAFNGRTAAGKPAVWVLINPYKPELPVAFVVPFHLKRRASDAGGILLYASVADALGRWWDLRSFEITLGRRFRVDGERRSYISARCPLPPRFSGLTVPLARATYRFDPAPTISTTILRACQTRD